MRFKFQLNFESTERLIEEEKKSCFFRSQEGREAKAK